LLNFKLVEKKIPRQEGSTWRGKDRRIAHIDEGEEAGGTHIENYRGYHFA
jgi:hypothetical protein